jgi:hypothetical protein
MRSHWGVPSRAAATHSAEDKTEALIPEDIMPGIPQDPVRPADQNTAGKGYQLLMFHLDNPQHSPA